MQRAQQREVVYRDDKHHIYRKVVVQRGRLIGALAAGDWPEMNRVQEAFMTERNISWWRLLLFRASGRLWLTKEDANVAQWPENTLVCQCNGISRGQLSQAMTQGCATVTNLQQTTKAGTVCGSCKPLLEQLCDQGGERQKEIAWLPVMMLSLLALALTALLVLIPELKVADSVQTRDWFEAIWNDKFFKQVSGFTLLGLTVIGLLMSLRKRLKFKWLGEFAYWRVLHLALGALCGLVLIFHTGFHLGDNLNRILIIDFLAIVLLGSSAGVMVSISHKFSPAKALSLRKFWAWVHILFTWPLPALLGIHILTVYYF
jgi:nitrite reductase (NADH) large subunit